MLSWKFYGGNMRTWSIRFLLLLVPCTALGQPDFWHTPGEIMRDSKGNITQQEIKDPKTFTMRVIDHGKWALTLHFRPNTDKVIRVEAPDFTADYGFDGDIADSVTFRGYGNPLVVRGTRDSMSTDGMAAVKMQRDSRGRDTKITYGQTTVATIEYADSGGVQRFTLGRELAITFNNGADGMHEVLTFNGKVVKETVVSGLRRLMPRRFSLDAVATPLELPDEWESVVRPHYSTMNFGPRTLSRDNGDVLARTVQWALGEVAFDQTGRPLYYDVWLNWSSIGGWTKEAYELGTAFNGVLPDHVVVTRDGTLQAWVESPKQGALMSLQTSLNDSSFFRFKIAGPTGSSPATGAKFGVSSETARPAAVPVVSRHAIKPELYYECGGWEDSQCWVRGDTAGCDDVWHTNWCWQEDYVPPPDGGDSGGGGSGSSYPSNKVVNNSILWMRANQGLTNADTKLVATRCSVDLLMSMPTLGGRMNAYEMLFVEQLGVGWPSTSAADWLNSFVVLQNGTGVRDASGNDVCGTGTASAWTTPGGRTVNLCGSFANLTSAMAGTILIHEMLHTLGVSEKPQDPAAPYTTDQITHNWFGSTAATDRTFELHSSTTAQPTRTPPHTQRKVA